MMSESPMPGFHSIDRAFGVDVWSAEEEIKKKTGIKQIRLMEMQHKMGGDKYRAWLIQELERINDPTSDA